MRQRAARAPRILLAGLSACSLTAAACGGAAFSPAPPGLDAASPVDGSAPTDVAADADPPAVADGLLLWLRADLGVTSSNGAVSQWADQSGNQLDARQPEATLEPTVALNGLGGRPTLVFNGSSFLGLPPGFSDFSAGISLFAVAVVNEVTACVDFVHLSNGVEIDDIALGRHDGRAHYEVLDGNLAGADFSLGRPHIISVVHDVDLSVSMRVDGGGRAQSTFALPRDGHRLSNVIGKSLYADCGSLHGGLAEVLVYGRALSDAERIRVETQLQTRWGCCR